MFIGHQPAGSIQPATVSHQADQIVRVMNDSVDPLTAEQAEAVVESAKHLYRSVAPTDALEWDALTLLQQGRYIHLVLLARRATQIG